MIDAGPPSPASHLRDVFYRMGLNDKVVTILITLHIYGGTSWLVFMGELFGVQEIVALSGAHTLGRSRPERSGWGKPETKYTVRKEPISMMYFLLFAYTASFPTPPTPC